MIFGPDLVRLVLERRKTQTRRLLKRDPTGTAPFKRCFYRPGRNYAVQRKRGGHEIARVEVTNLRREQLRAITFGDARAEGFRTTNEFKAYWVRMHDGAWVRRREGGPDVDNHEPLEEDELVDRFLARHADRIVWVIEFALLDQPHLLAVTGATRYKTLAGGRQVIDATERNPESDAGYTRLERDALPDEPEAVDDRTLSRFAEDAATRRAGTPGQREEALKARARSLANRLRQAAVAADRAGVDAGAQLDQIEQHLSILEQQRAAA